ncbi:LysR family transcriptional regulator [Nonomuraea sp. JJY05]|uniref:LysR family transcriptional regulator n=1 Tax=Nonomuraea sp. JJY05 TaxID=3350255 RepID=UPI00373EC951
MELRDIEIFLTLAEELHFGRTAERLHVSPARITQAIKKQERQIGTQLFVRNNRSVLLTPAGVRLRDDLRPIYHALGESVERAKREAQNKDEALRLGMLSTHTAELRPSSTRSRPTAPTARSSSVTSVWPASRSGTVSRAGPPAAKKRSSKSGVTSETSM